MPEAVEPAIHKQSGQGIATKNFLNSSRNRAGKRKTPLAQLVKLQERAFEIAQDPEEKASVACFAMRSFCMLQEERRKLTMQPLPKPVDVSKLGNGKRKAQAGPAYQEPGPNQAPEPTTCSVQPAKPEQGKAP